MKKTLLATALMLALAFVLSACGSSDSDSDEDGTRLAELKDQGYVTVAFANEKPYAYKEDGELKGAAVEVAEAVFNKLGIDEVKGSLSEWGQMIPGLNADKFDAITAGMAIKADRCENVLFSEPTVMYGEGLVVAAGNPLDIHSYEDIANTDASVSIMSGATEIDYVQSEGVSEDQIQNAPDIPATLSAVESGRADVTAGTMLTLRNAVDSLDSDKVEVVEDFEQPPIEGVPSYGATAFNPEYEDLVAAYDEALKELREDGTIEEILDGSKVGFSAKDNFPPSDITMEDVCSGAAYE